MYERNCDYADLAEEIIAEHVELQWIPQEGINIDFLESDKEKKSNGKRTYAECKHLNELEQFYSGMDFAIIVYEPNAALLDETQLRILIYHELLHVGKNGKVNPHDVEDFAAVINRFGSNWAKMKR